MSNTTLVSAPNAPLGRTQQAAGLANMTKAPAAVCQVDNCGVQAIGRCARCQRAFCASHQVYDDDVWGYPVPVASLCVQCLEIQREAERKSEEEWAVFKKYFGSGEALATLRRSRVQKVKVYRSYRRDDGEGYLGIGADKQYSFYGYGWVVAELGGLRWELGNEEQYILIEADRLMEEGKDPDNIEVPALPNYVTLFMDTDMDAARRNSSLKSADYGVVEIAQNYGLIPALPYADGYEHEVVQGWWRYMSDSAKAVQAVQRLASATS